MRGVLAALFLACAPSLARADISSGAQDGVVVDERGQPLADVYVVGKWGGTYATNIAHSPGRSCVHHEVTKTDAAGRFHLPAWRLPDTRLDVMDFFVDTYKTGYSQTTTRGTYKDSGSLSRLFSTGSVDMDAGKSRIETKPFEGDAVARAKAIAHSINNMGCPHPSAQDATGLYPIYQAMIEEASGLSPDSKELRDTVAWIKRIAANAWGESRAR